LFVIILFFVELLLGWDSWMYSNNITAKQESDNTGFFSLVKSI